MHTFHFSEPCFSSCLILKPRRKELQGMVSETDLFIRSQKDQRFKDVLNKQNPAMLCDWNAGTPQHNIVWTLQLGSEWHLFKLCTKALQTPFCCPPSVDRELCNWGCVASRLKIWSVHSECSHKSLWTMQSPRFNVCTPCVGMARNNRSWDK